MKPQYIFPLLLILTITSSFSNSQLVETPNYIYSDEFDDEGNLDKWSKLNEDVGGINGFFIENNSLHIEQTEETVWWQDHKNAPYIYQLISGDFSVSAQVNISYQGIDVSDGYHYAGIMARNPLSDNPADTNNFVFIGVGYQDDCSGQNSGCIETKSNIDNSPVINRYAITNTSSQLNLTRSGSVFSVYSRANDASNWILRNTYDRMDLTNELQLGLFGFSFYRNNKLILMSYDYFRLADEIFSDESPASSDSSPNPPQSSSSSPSQSSPPPQSISNPESQPTTPQNFSETSDIFTTTNPIPFSFSLGTLGIIIFVLTLKQNKRND